MKFRKKPVEVEAVQFWPHLFAELEFSTVEREVDSKGNVTHVIPTLEGRMLVSDGDWIITGIKGERYPCKPDIFEATYEEV